MLLRMVPLSQAATNINAVLPLWFPHALEATEQLFHAFESPLADRLAGVEARMSRRNGATTIVDGLSAMVATPGIAALEALREDYGIPAGDPRVEAIGEAALALYFYLRVQDDIVDEPEEVDRANVFLLEVFHGASQRAFARALGGSPEMAAFCEETMDTFASAAVWELDAFRGTGAEIDMVRLGQKFLPMAIPLGALALLAERPAHLPTLADFVTELGTGLQMVNDILNVKEDHMNRRLTPVLKWLYADEKVSSAETPARIRLALLANEVLPRVLGCAREAFRKAECTALDMGAPTLAGVARNRETFVESLPRRLFALNFQVNQL